MSDFTDDMAFYADSYENYLDELDRKERKLEKKKANDVYEYHVNKLGDKYKIADMKDDYLINCYKYFRRNYEYKKAFGFYIELRLRYPNDWREKIGDIE
jgi:hypothetical protein|uniref:Uncharacterized protein n=1 Tax=Podoviridae sp. ctiuS14 TaxID=2827620 RepID=A0A8S5LMB9_9CAUD|nr:MAG TPA: hypothetical protein [Podoviridae sp. ctiuS14]